MFSRAAVTVSTGPDLVVEGAVYFVGFSAEDGGEVVRHGQGIDGVRRSGVGCCKFALWMGIYSRMSR